MQVFLQAWAFAPGKTFIFAAAEAANSRFCQHTAPRQSLHAPNSSSSGIFASMMIFQFFCFAPPLCWHIADLQPPSLQPDLCSSLMHLPPQLWLETASPYLCTVTAWSHSPLLELGRYYSYVYSFLCNHKVSVRLTSCNYGLVTVCNSIAFK